MSFAIFDLSGNIPVVRDWLIIKVNDGTIDWLINFSNSVEIESYSALLFGLKQLITFVTISSGVNLKVNVCVWTYSLDNY